MSDYETRARQLVRAREFEALAELLGEAAVAGAMTPQLDIWAANLARERGDHEVAIASYRRALAELPDNAPAWFNLGASLEAGGEHEAAAAAFARSLGRPGGHRASLLRLGICLEALGRPQAARSLYAEGVVRGLLQHPLQRPGQLCEGLRAQPLWPSAGLGLEPLAQPEVLAELRACLTSRDGQEQRGQWRSPALARGRWDKLFFAHRGQLNPEMDALCPRTMDALRGVELAAGLPEGNVCLSMLAPHTELHPHCGPTNLRLRAHLGVEIPPDCGLRVAEREQTWAVGEWLVFDDSFEHTAWNRSGRERVILIVDLWHPDLPTPEARQRALQT